MNPNSTSSTPWDSPTTRSVSSSLEERLPKSEKYKKNERSGLNSYPQTTVHIHRKYTTHKQLKDHKPHPKTSENSTKPTSSQTQTHHQQDPKTENHHHQFKKKKTHTRITTYPHHGAAAKTTRERRERLSVRRVDGWGGLDLGWSKIVMEARPWLVFGLWRELEIGQTERSECSAGRLRRRKGKKKKKFN